MYLEYWGLKKFPFENVPNPDFMYYSPEHEEALARLFYVVRGNKGVVLISGEVGSGKTTLSRVLINQLPPEQYDIGLMTNPSLKPLDFLREVLFNLGLDPGRYKSKATLLKLLRETMLKNLRENRTTLLIFDEAQLISKETFEEIRLLLNFQLNDRFMMTVILLGQPELRTTVKSMAQLDQRIAIRYHLNPLNEVETERYIDFRLKKSGAGKVLFTDDGKTEIYHYSEGIPRIINNMCDMSLMIGCILQASVIDADIVRKAIEDADVPPACAPG